MLSKIEKDTLKTMAYYQAMGKLALTPLEIKKYITTSENVTLLDIKNTLNLLEKSGKVINSEGFWTIKNHPIKRGDNIKNAALKWRNFYRKAGFLPYIPYVRSVSVTGSTALNNARDKSDIDILITAKDNRLWTTRFLVTLVSFVLKRRRYSNKVEDRLCFNQYTSSSISNFGPRNIDNTVNNIRICVWDADKTVEEDALLRLKPNKILLLLKKVTEIILNISMLDKVLELVLGKLQLLKMQRNTTKYPSDLPSPQIGSSNLIFYYPRVLKTDKRYKKLLQKI